MAPPIIAVREPIYVNVKALSEDVFNDLLICPISLERLQDPVIDKCRHPDGRLRGHTFSRVYIEGWLGQNPRCPLSQQPLTRADLSTNLVVRDLLDVLNRPARMALNLQDLLSVLTPNELVVLRRALEQLDADRAGDLPLGIPDRLAPEDPRRSFVTGVIAGTIDCSHKSSDWLVHLFSYRP